MTQSTAQNALSPLEWSQLSLLAASDDKPRWERLALPPIHQQFKARAAAAPTARCLLFEGEEMNFGEVATAVDLLSSQLLSKGIVARSTIGVFLPRSFEFVISALAVLNLNCVYVPLDPALPALRLQSCADVAALSAVLTLPADIDIARSIAAAAGSGCLVIPVDSPQNLLLKKDSLNNKLLNFPPPLLSVAPATEDVAYIMFTSGSTGQPKGVACTHLGLVDAIDDHVERLGAKIGTTFELSHSSGFDAHLYPLFCPLVSGAALALCRPGGQVDPLYWIEFICTAKVDFVHSVPTPTAAYVAELRRLSVVDRKRVAVKEWDCIGEPFPAALADALGELLPELNTLGCINTYGPTESTIAVTHSRIPRGHSTAVTVGRPDANVHCYVVDPTTLQPVRPGEKGELLLSGPRLAVEYIGQHVKTATSFVANPCAVWALGNIPDSYKRYFQRAYRTGDLALWLPNGELQILGRIDRQVKIRGVRLELGEVEAALLGVPGVTGAAAGVREDPRFAAVVNSAANGTAGASKNNTTSNSSNNKRLLAWVTPESVDPGAALAHCASVLVAAGVPVAVMPLATFPTIGSGKVDASKLPDPSEWHADTTSTAAAAGDDNDRNTPLSAANGVLKNDEEEREKNISNLQDVAAAVTAAWQEALHIPANSLRPNSDFFMEGGTSLVALRANAQLTRVLSLSSPPSATLLYKTRTLQATIEAVKHLLATQNLSSSNSTTTTTTTTSFESKCNSSPRLPSSIHRKIWEDNVRPLSPGQEQMWLLASLAGSAFSASYVVPIAFRITGKLETTALEKALQGVASRQESLRMRYAVRPNGSLRGVISPSFRFPLKKMVLQGTTTTTSSSSSSSSSTSEARLIKEALRREITTPFDLESGPLVRAALFSLRPPPPSAEESKSSRKVSEEEEVSVLCITLHHAISDAWSLGVLCRELSILYQHHCCSTPFIKSSSSSSSSPLPTTTTTAAPEEEEETSLLPMLPCQFGDFAEFQALELQKHGRRQLAFWKKTLLGAPDLLNLPTDRPRPTAPTFSGAIYAERALSAEALSALRRLAASLRITPAALLLAAFHCLLSRICGGQEDIVVGVPVAQREHPEVQNLIGYFVSPVAVRGLIDPGAPFSEIALQIHDALALAVENDLIPFQEVVNAVGCSTGGAHNPVFQVMFQLLDDPVTLDLGQTMMTRLTPIPDLGISQMDLSLEISGVDGTITAEYSTALFGKDSIAIIVDSYVQLLESVVAAPRCSVQKLNILSEQQRKEVEMFGRGVERAEFVHGPLVHELFKTRAAEAPNARCLISNSGAMMTYGQVATAADVLSLQLQRQKGCKKGAVVGVLIGRSFEHVVSLLAILQCGCVYLPLDPEYPVGRLAEYIEDAEPVLLLTTGGDGGGGAVALGEEKSEESNDTSNNSSVAAQISKELTDIKLTLPPLHPVDLHLLSSSSFTSSFTSSTAAPPPPPLLPSIDDPFTTPAAIIFTSGSTGRPKGIYLTHGGLRDTALGSYSEMFNITASDVIALATSTGFDPHLGNTLGALVSGAALAIVPPGGVSDAVAVTNLFVNAKVSIMDQVPSIVVYYLSEFAKHSEKLALRVVLLGGEVVPPALVGKLQKAVPRLENGVYNAYGPSEFTVNATTFLLPPRPVSTPLGPPDPNVRAYVVDPTDITRLQPVGVPGELLLSGPRLAKSYLKKSSIPETLDPFQPNPFSSENEVLYRRVYRTGDLVRWSGEGNLEYLGRIDRQVKINGVRIELGEIEGVLLEDASVKIATVVALTSIQSSSSGGGDVKKLVGVVAPATVDVVALRARCEDKLMPGAVPSEIIAVEALPLLPSGKIDGNAVKKLALAAIDGGGGGFANGLNGNGGSAYASSSSFAAVRDQQQQQWYVPPSTDLESSIQKLWGEVLGVEADEISVEIDFFKAGGNSLRAGVLAASLRNALALPRLPATAVYQSKTVRGMALLIENMQIEEAAAGEASEKGPLPGGAAGSHPRADDARLELVASQAVPRTSLPYWLYIIIQYIMLALTMVLIPVIWGALLVALFALQPVVGIWPLIGIWPILQTGALFGYAALMVALKWILVQRLKPGVYPLHGWMYARWITLRALQDQAGQTFLPAIRRTPLMPLLLRALGARIESLSDTVIDSLSIFDFDLITIKSGACIYEQASVTGAFVAPAGYLSKRPMLVLSPVVIGRGCHLGHKSVVTAGTTIPDFHNLKPHASPQHPGDAPVAGPLADFPHFVPEERMSLPASMIGGLIAHIVDSLTEIPALALSLYFIYLILGDIPLVTGTSEHLAWRLVSFAALFTAFFGCLERPLGMTLHAVVVILWKWTALGRLSPGRDITKTKFTLLAYAILRRLVEAPAWEGLLELLTGTPLMAVVYRLLGATVGEQVFIGGLTVVEFDALNVGDYACSGSNARCYAVDDDGIITAVELKREATIGNGAVIFPGAVIRERAVVGNDTPICKDREVPRDTRVQGSIQYSVGVRSKSMARNASRSRSSTTSTSTSTSAEGGGVVVVDSTTSADKMDKMESGLGLPMIVQASADGAVMIDLPWWHSTVTLLVLFSTAPVAHFFLWIPLAVAATLLKATFWWLIPLGYVVMVGVGALLAVLWLRFLLEVSGIRKLWAAGSASVFDIRAQVIHAHFSINSAQLDVFDGTPFAVWIYRLLGFSVGDGAVLLGVQPHEAAMVSIGANSVVEAGAQVDGHYLEFLKFIYHSVKIGEGCWVQEGARLMPSTEMKEGSRVLPASMVLPGDTLEERMVWGGLPAEPIIERQLEGGEEARRKLLRSSRISRKSTREIDTKGINGYLGTIASKKQIAASKQL